MTPMERNHFLVDQVFAGLEIVGRLDHLDGRETHIPRKTRLIQVLHETHDLGMMLVYELLTLMQSTWKPHLDVSECASGAPSGKSGPISGNQISTSNTLKLT